MTDETKQVFDAVKDMFEMLNTKIDNMNHELNTKMDNMNDELNSKIDDLNSRLIRVETTLKNETNKNIKQLAEGYLPLAEKVGSLSENMDVVKFDVDIIKKVVTTHSRELDKLGKAR